MKVWIGLGSNLGDSAGLIASALHHLRLEPDMRLVRYSSLYRTVPWGLREQPDFCNAVAEFETGLDPSEILAVLQRVEKMLGRVRFGPRWGPRKIDIDLLLIGDGTFDLPGLSVPHPRMHQRAFVLEPLAELEPDLPVPGRGTVADCLARLYREVPDPAHRGIEKNGQIELPDPAGRPVK